MNLEPTPVPGASAPPPPPGPRGRPYALLLALLLPALAQGAEPVAAAAPLIALDAGHGGPRTGAISPEGLQEKDISRAVVERLAGLLEARGLRVLIVREGDVDVELRERVRRANAGAADLFVSVHCNAVAGARRRRTARGIETYFLSADATDEAARRLAESENAASGEAGPALPDDPLAAILLDLAVAAAHADSGRLARSVHQALVRETGWPDRGVRQAPFAVLNGAAMPAVLLELGFLSHPEEGAALGRAPVQAALAEAIADGLEGFLEVVSRREAGATVVAGR